MQRFGEPISRGWVTDERLVAQLLKPDTGTSELELKAMLMNEYEWTAERVHNAVGNAQADNTIRWVAYHGWFSGGRPA